VKISVLDHGYIEVKNVMGTDAFLAECARMSTDTVATEEANQRLVQRLIRDRHTSPIEFGQIVVEVAMPIFVMRQWVRHRTGAFNEFSGRYSVFPDIFYIPNLERIQYQATFNKQGSAESMPEEEAKHWQEVMRDESQDQYRTYLAKVDSGMTRELARINLGTNFYTKVRWTVNLHNLFHFIKLREDPHAQWEVQQYANVMHEIARQYFPVAVKAFEDHVQNAVTISASLAREFAEALANPMKGVDASNPELRDFLRKYGATNAD
jgi:thymidylate synthase (FAD)